MVAHKCMHNKITWIIQTNIVNAHTKCFHVCFFFSNWTHWAAVLVAHQNGTMSHGRPEINQPKSKCIRDKIIINFIQLIISDIWYGRCVEASERGKILHMHIVAAAEYYFEIELNLSKHAENWVNNQHLDKPNTIQKQLASKRKQICCVVMRPVFDRFHKHKTCWIASNQLKYTHWSDVTSILILLFCLNYALRNILLQIWCLQHFFRTARADGEGKTDTRIQMHLCVNYNNRSMVIFYEW